MHTFHFVCLFLLGLAGFHVANQSRWYLSNRVLQLDSLGKKQIGDDNMYKKTTTTIISSPPPHIPECTFLQRSIIRKTLPDGEHLKLATSCPDSDLWLSDYLDTTADTRQPNNPFVFLNFGCNKGYDSLRVANRVSRKGTVFNKTEWKDVLGISHKAACKQGSDKEVPTEHDESLTKRPVQVHCIEAMPQLSLKLKQAAAVTAAEQHGLQVYNYAMTGTPGGGTILFPNPQGHVGIEWLSMAHCQRDAKHCKEVETITVDEFVAKHVDVGQEDGNRSRIPYISIDVEGYDYTVMKAAPETLKRTDYLEFEFHKNGDWKEQRIRDAIDMLEGHGLVCYWAGVNRLWRMTNCWVSTYDSFHAWSNVACVNPTYQPELATRMEWVFDRTLEETLNTIMDKIDLSVPEEAEGNRRLKRTWSNKAVSPEKPKIPRN